MARVFELDLRRRELTPGPRKPINEFAFTGAWGRPAEWLLR